MAVNPLETLYDGESVSLYVTVNPYETLFMTVNPYETLFMTVNPLDSL